MPAICAGMPPAPRIGSARSEGAFWVNELTPKSARIVRGSFASALITPEKESCAIISCVAWALGKKEA